MDVIMRSATNEYNRSGYSRDPLFAPPKSYARPRGQRHKVCRYWISGNCKWGQNCRFIHSWSQGDGFSMLTQLHGHKKSITGIALPSGSDRLYTTSTDGTVRIWSCHSGQCDRVINNGSEIGSLCNEGSWVFIGLSNRIRAWNIRNGVEVNVETPCVGQIYSIAIDGDTLFAGGQDGSITALKAESVANTLSFKVVASLKEHTGAVTCLKTGASKTLFSGSTDKTVRVWDSETMQCVHVLKGHTQTVTSLLCYDQFLISGSLDKTVKVWTEMKEVYTHKEEGGVVALHGLTDEESKPVLVCSCDDDTVYIYHLPSFTEKGRIFSKRRVGVIQSGPSGLFFTGEGSGSVTVWNMETKSS